MGGRLARGVFWSFAGTAISRGLVLAATVTIARILGKVEFGEVGIIQSTVGMFGVFAGFGLGLTATKYVAEFREKDPVQAGRILGLSSTVAVISGGLMAGVLVLAAPWLASETLNAPHLAGPLRVGALILFFSALNGAQTGALAGFEAFRTIARVNVVVGFVSFPLLLLGAYLGGVLGVVWALAVNLGIHWVLNHLAVRREATSASVPFNVRFTSAEARILIHFSLPSAVNGLLIAPANWGARALLVRQPGGYEDMGIVAAALTFQALVLFVSGALSAPLLSMLSKDSDSNTSALAKINILSSWALGVYSALPLLAFPALAELVFGGEYSGYDFRLTVALLVVTTCIVTYKAGLARVLAARDLLWWGVVENTLWATALIGFAVLLVPLGAPGFAGAILISYVLITVIFVPLYSGKQLVPMGTLMSIPALGVWSVLFLLAFLGVTVGNQALQLLLFVAALAVVTYCFVVIYKSQV